MATRSDNALWFGLFGAPAGWSVQVMVGYALSAHACFPRSTPLSAPLSDVRFPLLALTMAATLVALAAGMTALAIWRRTKNEERGSGASVLEIGEGRRHFMALAGVFVSGLFLLAIVMSFLSLSVVPPCSYGA